MPYMATKIILDTDIGTEIDDAVCLAYLLAQPKCELLGITTVTGEADKRAMMASTLCKIAEKDIPIYPGLETPLLIPQKQIHAHQATKLKNWKHEKHFPEGKAIEFLKETIYAHPGEVTLLTIGPLTNIALLFATHPEVPSLLKGLVMMGGLYKGNVPSFTQNVAEWNISLDPHAAAIVFNAPVKKLRAIGLDVTTQVFMHAKEVKKKFQAPLLAPIVDFAEVLFKERDKIFFHDPLAGTTIFDDNICGFEKATIHVELTNEKILGATIIDQATKQLQHAVATTVNKDLFFAHYFSVVNK